MSARPFFSIVIPAYDRARLVGRAIRSCLDQTFSGFEIVVVDDGSADGTPEAVRAFPDPRIRLVLHGENRGVCPARNTGADAAAGDWIVFLDSDDELLPDALETIRRRAAGVGDRIGRMVFMYRVDRGGLSPEPPLSEETWDFGRYVRWSERARPIGDFLNVVRRDLFRTVRYPDGRAFEGLFHLDLASRFDTGTFPDVVAILHTDAGNRSMARSPAQLVRDAAGDAESFDRVLQRHGDALREKSPGLFERYLRASATAHFLCGRRGSGLRRTAQCLRRNPFSGKSWIVLAAGILGPAPLARLKAGGNR